MDESDLYEGWQQGPNECWCQHCLAWTKCDSDSDSDKDSEEDSENDTDAGDSADD